MTLGTIRPLAADLFLVEGRLSEHAPTVVYRVNDRLYVLGSPTSVEQKTSVSTLVASYPDVGRVLHVPRVVADPGDMPNAAPSRVCVGGLDLRGWELGGGEVLLLEAGEEMIVVVPAHGLSLGLAAAAAGPRDAARCGAVAAVVLLALLDAGVVRLLCLGNEQMPLDVAGAREALQRVGR